MSAKKNKGFSHSQQYRYRGLVKAAWATHAEMNGINTGADGAYETWYRAELLQAIGRNSTKEANPVEDYDIACLHFACIANDFSAIDYFSAAAERRMIHLIMRGMQRLTKLEGRAVDWNYIRSIYKSMELPLSLEDAPASILRKVYQALDTHIRRIDTRSRSVSYAA
jgi:hypothetical protein